MLNKYQTEWYIVLIASLAFLPFLGGVHLFDWDEINFAEIAREMIILRDYLRIHIDFQPFYEKPPLYFWLQALSMNLWGINEYAARFPNAICGIITLIVIFKIGEKLQSRTLGRMWAIVYFGSILPHLYFKSGIIDPWFNLFIFLGLYFLILYHWKKNNFNSIELPRLAWVYWLLAGIFTGLAVLTKGYAALLLITLTLGVYWIYVKFKWFISPLIYASYVVVALLTFGLWLLPEILINGTEFTKEFFIRQWELFSRPDAGHKGFLGYHVVVFLLGVFPASWLSIRAFYRFKIEVPHEKDFRIFMIILFGVVIVLFSIVQTKIVHYSSLMYFPATYLASLVILRVSEGRISIPLYTKIGIGIVGSLWAFAGIALPFIGKNIYLIQRITADDFARANMQAQVNWSAWQAVAGFILLGALIYAFNTLRLNQPKKGFIILFAGTACYVQAILYLDINNIEAITQRASIEFYKHMQKQDAYVKNIYYKSYAQLFYTAKQKPQNLQSLDENWLLYGDIDKDVYFVSKNIDEKELQARFPFLEKINEKNGFVFFIRRKTKNN